MAKTRKVPYWIEGGGETCACCGNAYAHQSERRCEACDAPLCPCCADAQFGDPVLCAECRAEAAEEDK